MRDVSSSTPKQSRSTARCVTTSAASTSARAQQLAGINPFDLPPFDSTDDDLRDPLRDHIASLQRLMQLLLADRGHTLTGEEVAILDLALAATYSREWHDDATGEVRGGFASDPRTHRRDRTPLMADLLNALRHLSNSPRSVRPCESLATRWRGTSRVRSPISSASPRTWR